MKKSSTFPIALLCCAFFGILIGVFIWCNCNHTDIQISKRPADSALQTNQSDSQQSTQSTAMVNINTATLDELDALPGIGKTLAQSIIDYREENGLYTSVTQLTNINGIGVERLNSIMDYITVGG